MTDPSGTDHPTVWQATLDDRYDVRVTHTEDPYLGQLSITDTLDNRVLLEEPVPLSYGAVFGPDMDDVAAWQERGVAVIDALPKA